MSVSSLINQEIIYELAIETTKIMLAKQNELQNISWTEGEANLDTEYSKLACCSCVVAWNKLKIKNPHFKEIQIECCEPDINITFTYPDKKTTPHKIELKSSKSNKMPGSTIKKLDINQPLIYCLRPTNITDPYQIKCSQYHYAMGESDTDLFQDRTPRPILNFKKMADLDNTLPFMIKDKDAWIEHYANCGVTRIKDTTDCQKSWQDDMIKIMQKKFIEEYIRNTSVEEFTRNKEVFT